jgi:hypothetical protein
MAVIVLGIIGSSLAHILDPLHWGSGTYFVVIVGILLLRFLTHWPDTGPALFLEEVCLILPAGLFYFFVRGLVAADSRVAIAHARRIVTLERTLGFFLEPRLQRIILPHTSLIDLANWIYIWAHWPVILVWVVWMWTRHRAAYPLYRNAVLLSGAAGMVVFALYPVAPPRLVPDLGMVDTVTQRSLAYRVLQPPALADLYASMPSLHFGWNLLVGIAIARHARTAPGRLLGVLLPAAMFCAIILTANHFLLDGVAGGIFALTGLAGSAALARRHAQPTSAAITTKRLCRVRARLSGEAKRANPPAPTRRTDGSTS